MAGSHPLRVLLGNVHVNAQCCRLRNVEEVGLRSGTAAGVDKVADIGVAGGDYAIERSIYLFERNERLVAQYVRVVCVALFAL